MNWIKYFFRLLSLPFVTGVIILAIIKKAVIFMYCYIRYGGELLIYDDKINPKTVGQILEDKLK